MKSLLLSILTLLYFGVAYAEGTFVDGNNGTIQNVGRQKSGDLLEEALERCRLYSESASASIECEVTARSIHEQKKEESYVCGMSLSYKCDGSSTRGQPIQPSSEAESTKVSK